jgi:hypothetical protein
MFQSDNEARAAPKFNIVAGKQLLGALDGISIVRAIQRFEPDEMPVGPNRTGSVFCHPDVPWMIRMYDQTLIRPVQMWNGDLAKRFRLKCWWHCLRSRASL